MTLYQRMATLQLEVLKVFDTHALKEDADVLTWRTREGVFVHLTEAGNSTYECRYGAAGYEEHTVSVRTLDELYDTILG